MSLAYLRKRVSLFFNPLFAFIWEKIGPANRDPCLLLPRSRLARHGFSYMNVKLVSKVRPRQTMSLG